MNRSRLKSMKNIVFKQPGIKKDEGFTLVEMVFAISILAVGILGVASMQISAIRSNNFAHGTTESTTWAMNKVEELINIGLSDYDNSDLEDTDNDGSSGLNHATSATADHEDTQGRYNIYWNVAADSLIDDTKTISVIVIWTDHGTEKSVTMQHVIPEVS